MLDDLIEFDSYQNIAEELDLDLAKIGDEVVEGFEADLRSRNGWEEEMKEAMDLVLQIREAKNFPWEDASNVKMPLMTEAAMHYNSMMYPALIPTVDIVKGRIVGKDPDGQKNESAIRISKHMSYQVLEEMEEWEEEMDIGLMIQPILGNMYKKTYYSDGKARNMSDMLSPKEFVVDYNTKNLESAFRKTHIIPMNLNDVRKEVLFGNFLDEDYGTPQQMDKEKEGESPPQVDQSTQLEFLEIHTYLDLDSDDLLEPYIVTVERKSKKVARIVTCFDVDQILADDQTVIDVPQLQYFTKYGFVPNPDGGFLDLGLGKLLGPTNHSVNTLINQLIDAGTKSIMGGGFLGKGLRVKGGKLKFTMGEYKRVDTPGQDLARNIVHLPQIQPSAVLFQLLGMLINAGQRLSSTLDSQVGENPGQNQKATTSAIVQEQGQKIFNGIYKRNLRSLKKEFKKLFYLNSIYLDDESYLNILDGAFPPEMEQTIKRIDYDVASVNIIPAADSSYQSQTQKMAKAQALMQKIPTGMVNPQVALRAVLEAEEQPNIDQIMDVGQPQPSLDEVKQKDESKLNWAKLQLDVIKAEQDDIKIQSQAILALAQAEGIEPGQQIEQYKAELAAIVTRSKDLGAQASGIRTAERDSNSGMEAEQTDEVPQTTA
jgi:chaperonin GroES